MDLGSLGVLRGEEIVEIGFGIDLDRVPVAQFFCPLIQPGLDLVQDLRDRADYLFDRFKGFFLTERSRRAMATVPFSKSRGPSSRRMGTPRLIQSQFLTPPPRSRLSISTETGSPAYSGYGTHSQVIGCFQDSGAMFGFLDHR